MRGISGCPVNPLRCVVTVTAQASSVWMADTVRRLPSRESWTFHSHLFLSFDLYHPGVVNDDLN